MTRPPRQPSPPSPSDDETARRRLALTRVLIWAEREAEAMELRGVAAQLRAAIDELHPDAG